MCFFFCLRPQHVYIYLKYCRSKANVFQPFDGGRFKLSFTGLVVQEEKLRRYKRAKQHPREISSSCETLMKQEKYQPTISTKEMLRNIWWILTHGNVLENNGFKM